MPLVDVENYDDVVVPFLDVAVCDDSESLIHSIRSSDMNSVTPEPNRMNRARASSLPAAVITSSLPNSIGSDESDDELSCTRSVRTASSGRRGSTNSRSRLGSRFLSSITSMDSSIHSKLRSSRERTLELAVVGDDSEISEGDRVTYLEEEIQRLNADLASSRSKHAIAKVRSRQLAVELEDLEAFCQKLQEENTKLKEENEDLRRNGVPKPKGWFGLGGSRPTKEDQNKGEEIKQSPESSESKAATEDTISTLEQFNRSRSLRDIGINDISRSKSLRDIGQEDVLVQTNSVEPALRHRFDRTPETPKSPWWAFGSVSKRQLKFEKNFSNESHNGENDRENEDEYESESEASEPSTSQNLQKDS